MSAKLSPQERERRLTRVEELMVRHLDATKVTRILCAEWGIGIRAVRYYLTDVRQRWAEEAKPEDRGQRKADLMAVLRKAMEYAFETYDAVDPKYRHLSVNSITRIAQVMAELDGIADPSSRHLLQIDHTLKLTTTMEPDELMIAALEALVLRGATFPVAAAAYGIPMSSFVRWMRLGSEDQHGSVYRAFYLRLNAAKARVMISLNESVQRQEKGWEAKWRLLEALDAQSFAKDKRELPSPKDLDEALDQLHEAKEEISAEMLRKL